MMKNNPPQNQGIFDLIALPALFCLLVYAIWYSYSDNAIAIMLFGAEHLFEYFSHIPYPLISKESQVELLDVSVEAPYIDPELASSETFIQLIGLWGEVARLLLIPLFIYLAFHDFKLPVNYRFRRKLNIEELARQNSEMFPEVLPALGKDIHKEDPYVGPWRIADDYIGFAMMHGLLRYKANDMGEGGKLVKHWGPKEKRLSIDKKRKKLPNKIYTTLCKSQCDELIKKQMGPIFVSVDPLDRPIKGLLVALMALSCGGHYRAYGRELLGMLSRRMTDYEDKEKLTSLSEFKFEKAKDLKKQGVVNASDLCNKVLSHKNIRPLLGNHAYLYTIFIAVLVASRTKAGKVPPNSFLWLRPYNRELWYTLHPIGGRKAWVEGIAGWTQYQSEKELGKPISKPCFEAATDSIEAELHKEGWILSPRIHADEQAALKEEQELLTQAQEIMESNGGSWRN